jgi:hypothetical protein
VRRTATAVLVAVLVLAGACGGDDSSSTDRRSTTSTPAAGAASATDRGAAAPAGEGPQACDLLTPADLQAALHRPFAAGAPTPAPAYGSGCTWGTTSVDPALFVSISVATDEQLQVALGRVASALYEQTRDAAQVDENLSLGDASYRAGLQVVVLDDGVLLSLATTDTSPASISAIEALARTALARLPG